MTTVEKLLVQIFDRKNSIIERVKQQTELYNQHLASKLLIDGITPPSWVWNPNHPNSKELNKEELIERLLHPYPQSSVHCSTAFCPAYNNPAGSRENAEIPDGFFRQTLASSKGLIEQDPIVPDVSITSPEDQTDKVILNIHNAPDQSLARIHRSKSRQKALENRSSAKSLPKSALNHEINSDDFRLSSFSMEQDSQKNEPQKLAENCGIGESCKDGVLGESDWEKVEKGVDVYAYRFTRSRSNVKVPDFGTGSIELGCSADNCRDVSANGVKVRTRSSVSTSDSKQDDYVTNSRNSAGPSSVGFKNCGSRKLDGVDCQGKDMEINVYNGRTTRSKSSSDSRSCANKFSKADSSSDNVQRNDIVMMEYADNVPVDSTDGSLVRVNQPHLLDEGCGTRESVAEDCKSQKEMGSMISYGRMTRSRSSSHNNAFVGDTPDRNIRSHSPDADVNIFPQSSGRSALQAYTRNEELALGTTSLGTVGQGTRSKSQANEQDISNSQDHSKIPCLDKISRSALKMRTANDERLNASSGQIGSPSYETHCTINEQGDADLMFDNGLLLCDVVDRSVGSSFNDAKHKRAMESLVACPFSNSFAFVEPKQLGINVLQNDNLKTSTSSSGEKGPINSSEMMACSSSDPPEPIDKKISGATSQVFSVVELPETLDVLVKGTNLFDFNVQEKLTQAEKYAPTISRRNNSRRCQDNAEACVNLEPIDKAISGATSPVPIAAVLPETSDALIKEIDLFDFNVHEKNDSQAEKCAPTVSGHNNSRSCQDNAEACVNLEPIDKTISGATSPVPIAADFLETSDALIKGIDLLDFNIHEKIDSQAEKSAPTNSSRSCQDNLEDCVNLEPIDKTISGATSQVYCAAELPETSDALIKGTDSFEFNVHEKLDSPAEKCTPTVSGHNNSRSCQDNVEACQNCEYSEVQGEVDIMQSDLDGTSDLKIPLELRLEPEHDSFIEKNNGEGNWNDEEQDTGSLVSNASGSKNCILSYSMDLVKKASAVSRDCLISNGELTNPTFIVHDKINQIQTDEPEVVPCLECEVSCQNTVLLLGENGLVRTGLDRSSGVEDFSLVKRFRPSVIESCPPLKRRKIEYQQTTTCTTSPNFRMRMLHRIQIGPASRCLNNTEMDVENRDKFEVTNASDNREMNLRIHYNLTEGLESSFESQNEEVPLSCKERNEYESSVTAVSNEQLYPLSSPTNKKVRKLVCFVEGMRTPHSSNGQLNSSDPDDRKCCLHSSSLDKDVDTMDYENLDLTNRILQGKSSSRWEEGRQLQSSMPSPRDQDLEFIDVHQSMPVFEGFTVDAQTDSGEMDFAAVGLDLDKLNLTRSTIERASILANICRSSCMHTPLSDLTSSSKFQGTRDVFQSVPSGYLESVDLRSTFPLNADVNKHTGNGNSFVNDVNDSFEKMPYTDCLPYSGARYGWNVRNQHASPVGKLWERLSYHTGSSGKSLSSNPELTCFRIEEDPCTSGDNTTMDETADDVQEEIDSLSAIHCNKRQPLKEMTNLSQVPPASNTVQDEILRVGSAVFVNTEYSVTAAQNKVQRSTKKQISSLGNTVARKNQAFAIGANGIKKAKGSISNSVRKPSLRSKSGLKIQERKLSFKESRRNNIVSSVNSFLPLVQQKEAAPICAGKRDVKVKALEAAEGARQLEEKREYERKVRKEALKLERAKMEEKNLRQREAEKKKKEEERKKKDADVMARKRLREEEEKKEREKKRMRLDARKQQREQEEKVCAGRAEKEKQHSKDEKTNSKKEFNEPKKHQNRDIVRGVNLAVGKAGTKLIPAGVTVNHKEVGISDDSFQAVEAMHAVDKSPANEDLIVQKTYGSSYVISPYQCSDDENEDDDELSTKKYIPSWASTCSVALDLPSLQEMDPDAIFCPKSGRSMNEVLLLI